MNFGKDYTVRWKRSGKLSSACGGEASGPRPAEGYSTHASIRCLLCDYRHAGGEHRPTDVFGPGQIPAAAIEVSRDEGASVRLRIINMRTRKIRADVTRYVPAHKGWAVGWLSAEAGDYIAEVLAEGIHLATLRFAVLE